MVATHLENRGNSGNIFLMKNSGKSQGNSCKSVNVREERNCF